MEVVQLGGPVAPYLLSTSVTERINFTLGLLNSPGKNFTHQLTPWCSRFCWTLLHLSPAPISPAAGLRSGDWRHACSVQCGLWLTNSTIEYLSHQSMWTILLFLSSHLWPGNNAKDTKSEGPISSVGSALHYQNSCNKSLLTPAKSGGSCTGAALLPLTQGNLLQTTQSLLQNKVH